MIIVDQGQSLFDVAIQYCGSAIAVFDLAVLNEISITDKLVPGTSLLLPSATDAAMVKYFKDNGFVPATGLGITGQIDLLEGIGYWGIGIDFIVS